MPLVLGDTCAGPNHKTAGRDNVYELNYENTACSFVNHTIKNLIPMRRPVRDKK